MKTLGDEQNYTIACNALPYRWVAPNIRNSLEFGNIIQVVFMESSLNRISVVAWEEFEKSNGTMP